jgi:hypothetical protein
MLLWNWDDLKGAWSWAHPRNLKKLLDPTTYMFWRQAETPEERLARKIDDPNLDPHYKLILRNKYKEVPLWWWGAILIISFVVGIVCLYSIKVGGSLVYSPYTILLTLSSPLYPVGDSSLRCVSPSSSPSSSALSTESPDSASTYSQSVRCWLVTFSPVGLLPTSTSHALHTTRRHKPSFWQRTCAWLSKTTSRHALRSCSRLRAASSAAFSVSS